MIKNYFVCVGAQKSGTTWLANMLARHPDFFFTPVKEIHYFDHIRGITQHLSDKKRNSRFRKYRRKLLTQPHRFAAYKSQWRWYRDYMSDPLDDDWYRSLFRYRGGATFAGEATPEYALIGEDGFRHIQRLAPDVRLLFIMRNPVSQCWSQLLHHFRSHGEDVKKASDYEILSLAESERISALSDYIKVIDTLAKIFRPDQVRVEYYENIHSDRDAALNRISAFIGMAPFPTWKSNVERLYNRSQSAMMPGNVRTHFQGQFRNMAVQIGDRYGHLPENWVKEFSL